MEIYKDNNYISVYLTIYLGNVSKHLSRM